jgi:phytoene dehydrogenase-like protein
MDAVVVGGGLAGLSAASYLARAGRSVLLLERASAVGGNARTRDQDGFLFNLGPHALYREGAGMSVLRELGVRVAGGIPGGGYALSRGKLHTLPVGPASLLATGLLPLGAKVDVGRLLARLPRMDAAPLAGTTVAEWLQDLSPRPEVRSLLAMITRVTTYTDAPDRQSAGAALAQLQLALRHGVVYLDAGWGVLVDGLRRVATESGAELRTGAHVTALEQGAGRVTGVRLATGESVPADAVVLAAGPAAAQELLADPSSLVAAAPKRLPALAACLDVGLRRLPAPRRLVVLGFDRPLYLSVHSAVARLAPDGAAMVHVMRYLGAVPAADPEAVERELEGLLDRVQPGWALEVVHRRFIPHLVVSHDVGSAAAGGLAGRATVTLPGQAGVYLAGEWVGSEGLLADAALASGRAAARAALEGAMRRIPAA